MSSSHVCNASDFCRHFLFNFPKFSNEMSFNVFNEMSFNVFSVPCRLVPHFLERKTVFKGDPEKETALHCRRSAKEQLCEGAKVGRRCKGDAEESVGIYG